MPFDSIKFHASGKNRPRSSGHLDLLQAMKERIDSPGGRRRYCQRIGTVEPVFGNLRHNNRLNRFTLRGNKKVGTQWRLYWLVHSIEKLAGCGLRK